MVQALGLCLRSLLVIIFFRPSECQRRRNPNGAHAGLQVQQACGPQLLEAKGIYWGWRPTVLFDQNQIKITPPKPKIPGCFNLTALNVSISQPLSRGMTAEFEMRIGKVPDVSLPKLKCKKRLGDSACSCGTNNSCMFCDFCTHIKQHVPNLKFRERQAWNNGNSFGQRHKYNSTSGKYFDPCECQITTGVYDIRAEICTPTSTELETVLPAAVVALVGQKTTVKYSTVIPRV